MKVGSINQQPAEELDYDVDHAEWLAEGDTVQSAVADLADPGSVVLEVFPSPDSVKVWVSGGVDGQEGTIEVTTRTAGGRVIQSEIALRVQEII